MSDTPRFRVNPLQFFMSCAECGNTVTNIGAGHALSCSQHGLAPSDEEWRKQRVNLLRRK